MERPARMSHHPFTDLGMRDSALADGVSVEYSLYMLDITWFYHDSNDRTHKPTHRATPHRDDMSQRSVPSSCGIFCGGKPIGKFWWRIRVRGPGTINPTRQI